ncbi:MAG: glycine zipper 2TM domain-containing protein [Thiobacillus sp.]|nr:glycine zipper 2TM domain-containing protein [Thiobacillus sp.]
MNALLKSALILAGVAIAGPAMAAITFYEREGFDGRSFLTENEVDNFKSRGFNDRASSVVVWNYRWEVCDDSQFRGRCVVLRPGRYPSLAAMGLNDRVSSVRAVGWNDRFDEGRYAPTPPIPVYDAHRRQGERLFQARVSSVRAVVGPPDRRCWIERERVVRDQRDGNVSGAIVGAIIGGILGHQVGDGQGRYIATAGGAVAGAAVGANAGRDGQQAYGRDVQHCADVPNQDRPEYWDVIYRFRGQEHRVQMAASPGATVTVNRQGEPRE